LVIAASTTFEVEIVLSTIPEAVIFVKFAPFPLNALAVIVPVEVILPDTTAVVAFNAAKVVAPVARSVPPIFVLPPIPTPPVTTTAPVVVEDEADAEVKSASPPTYIVPFTPMPPPTVNAPDVGDVELVVLGIFNAPKIFALVIFELPRVVVLLPPPTEPYPIIMSFVVLIEKGFVSAPINTL
jgi:hypothetical protein